MTIDLQTLRTMSPERRAQLYENARRKRDEGGQAIIDLIDSSGLPLRSGGMTLNDPVYLAMEEIIWSHAARARLLEAVEEGLPALAGVEPMIRETLGERYHPHDQGTANAGAIVGEVMRHLGFTPVGMGKMPQGSVAKTAKLWGKVRRDRVGLYELLLQGSRERFTEVGGFARSQGGSCPSPSALPLTLSWYPWE